MISTANRPTFLSAEYALIRPERLYITGDLSAALEAAAAADEIKEVGGAHPSLDRDLSFMNIPYGHPDSVTRIKQEHVTNLLRGPYPDSREVLVVAKRPVSEAVAFLLGRAVENPQIERTYFLGKPDHLGALAAMSEIQLLGDPLGVYRWQHPDGASLPVTRESLQ